MLEYVWVKNDVNGCLLITTETPSMVDVNVDKMVKEKKRKAINILKNKIKFISKMAKMQRVLREESENIIKIKVD